MTDRSPEWNPDWWPRERPDRPKMRCSVHGVTFMGEDDRCHHGTGVPGDCTFDLVPNVTEWDAEAATWEPGGFTPMYVQLYTERRPRRWRQLVSKLPGLRRLGDTRREITYEAPVVEGVAMFTGMPEISGTFTIMWSSAGLTLQAAADGGAFSVTDGVLLAPVSTCPDCGSTHIAVPDTLDYQMSELGPDAVRNDYCFDCGWARYQSGRIEHGKDQT